MRARQDRGVTLIEALLASFLVLLVGVLTMTVIVNAKVLTTTTQDESEAALDLQASTWLLTRELSESTAENVTVSSTPMGIAFPSARDAQGVFQTDENGRPVWKKYVVYWVDDGLHRAEVKVAVKGPLPARIFGLLRKTNGRLVSGGIKALRVTADPQRPEVTIEALWSGRTQQGKTDEAHVTFEVTLWN